MPYFRLLLLTLLVMVREDQGGGGIKRGAQQARKAQEGGVPWVNFTILGSGGTEACGFTLQAHMPGETQETLATSAPPTGETT